MRAGKVEVKKIGQLIVFRLWSALLMPIGCNIWHTPGTTSPRWDTAGAEINVPYDENPELCSRDLVDTIFKGLN